MHWITAVLISCVLSGCLLQRTSSTSTREYPTTRENLIVFVGQRLDVEERDCPDVDGLPAFDHLFHAKYRVLQVLYGKYDGSEIEFDAYDHYGAPRFADFDTDVLYVSRCDDRLVHEKYQFQEVYRTADGTWAGCGDPYKYEPEVHRGSIRARPVQFEPEVSFPIDGLTEEEVAEQYPKEYFRRSNGRMVCQAGTSLEELFEIKRAGVLKARGLFE